MKFKSEVVGWLVTVIYLLCVLVFVYVKRDGLTGLGLSEAGDFLAGVFGPVAFLWLVLGYLQQGRELKASSSALASQSEELALNVQQQVRIAELHERLLSTQVEVAQRQELQFKLMVEPNFQLFSRSSGFRNGNYYVNFVVGNIGIDAQKLTVSLGGSTSKKVLSTAQLLRNGGDLIFVYDYIDKVMPCVFNVSVEYVNFVGLRGVQSFRVKNFLSEKGSREIEISKYTGA